jgi:hypothetical protein
MSVGIHKLISKQDSDIRLFQKYAATLRRKLNTRAYVADLERRIALAERSKAMLKAAR